MGLKEYKAMQREWRERPPTNRLVAAYLGYEVPPDQPQDDSIEGLLEFARGIGADIKGF